MSVVQVIVRPVRQVTLQVQPARQVTLQVITGRGPRGLPGDGSGMTVGQGLTIVGNEIRYDFENLTRG